MNLLDASAIFNLFQGGKYNVLIAGATIPLARYEIGNILWKNYKLRNRITNKEAVEAGTVLFELLDSMEQIAPPYNSVLNLSHRA
jgi:predicted nucleic acid-binding protein